VLWREPLRQRHVHVILVLHPGWTVVQRFSGMLRRELVQQLHVRFQFVRIRRRILLRFVGMLWNEFVQRRYVRWIRGVSELRRILHPFLRVLWCRVVRERNMWRHLQERRRRVLVVVGMLRLQHV
jgi:hypothetical protein